MQDYKEIITKAVIAKGAKNVKKIDILIPKISPTNILGCLIVNHDFKGSFVDSSIIIEGSFEVNVWYLGNNDTKTDIASKTVNYREVVIIPSDKINTLNRSEIIINSLKDPKCINASIVDGKITVEVVSELDIEVVGETKIKIPAASFEEVVIKIEDNSKILEAIDNEVVEDYL